MVEEFAVNHLDLTRRLKRVYGVGVPYTATQGKWMNFNGVEAASIKDKAMLFIISTDPSDVLCGYYIYPIAFSILKPPYTPPGDFYIGLHRV